MATALENTGPAHLVDPTTGHPAPPANLTLSGWRLLEFTGKHAAADGSYAAGIGIFHNAENTFHPYAVWMLILLPHGEWVREGGDYCENLADALVAYKRRGGKQ